MCSVRSTLAIVVNMTDIELTDCPHRHKRLQTTYPSRCLLGVFDVAGVGFALFSSLDVDSEDTDAKSSFKNQTKKHHEFVDIRQREICLYLFRLDTAMH